MKTHFNHFFMIIKMYAPSQIWISPSPPSLQKLRIRRTWYLIMREQLFVPSSNPISHAGSSQPEIPNRPWRFLWLQQWVSDRSWVLLDFYLYTSFPYGQQEGQELSIIPGKSYWNFRVMGKLLHSSIWNQGSPWESSNWAPGCVC